MPRKGAWSRLRTSKMLDPGPGTFELSPSSECCLPGTNLSGLLIVCLVEQLCSFIEKETLKSRRLNEILLQQLQELGLVDDCCASPQFEEMRLRFKQDLAAIVGVAQRIVGGEEPAGLATVATRIPLDEVDCPPPPRSRYASDFEVLGYISRGGFGQVFRVRNKLDGCKYAIKKIVVRSQQALYQSIIQEVTVLARLQHPGIVKYYAAWLEPAPSLSGLLGAHHWAYLDTHHTQSARLVEESSGSSFIQFRSDDLSSRLSEVTTSSEEQSRQETVVGSGALCEQNWEPSTFSEDSERAVVPRLNQAPGAVLYIQMELCGRSLRQWLDWRPVEADPGSMLGFLQLRTRLSFFWQLAAALEYLHDQAIVHHDIKPSNVFVFGSHRVKLGDFGLACSYEHGKQRTHLPVGTCTYAAPEQLKGGLCNLKSDVYSTGLVLLELLMPPFPTSAERIHVLSQLREQGKVPETIRSQLPQWSTLVRRLTSSEPHTRPSASGLKVSVEELLCREPPDSREQPRDLPHDLLHNLRDLPHDLRDLPHDLRKGVRERKRGGVLSREEVARVRELAMTVESLRAELRVKDLQIRALREQVRLLSLQLLP